MVVVVLTSGTTWLVPSDFDPANNTVELIGGGGGGGPPVVAGCCTSGGAGGGGGEYRRNTNVALTPGSTISIAIGAAGTAGGGNGGNTTFNSSAMIARGGSGSTTATGGAGGTGGTGTTGFNGGSGGSTAGGAGGAGGGGAAGSANNGTNGSNGAGLNGGTGGAGGTGGGTGGAIGTNGGTGTNLGAGAAGSGGGGGGANFNGNPGTGGQYGGGGGGAGAVSGTTRAGFQGVIVVTYTPRPPTAIFSRFDLSPRPFKLSRARTDVGFVYFQPVVGPSTPTNLGNFSPFDPPPKPPRHAIGTITFTTDPAFYATPITALFTPFSVPPKPPHFSKAWIAPSFQYATIPVPPEFMSFSLGRHAPNRAIAWTTWDWFFPSETPKELRGFYMPFSPGRTAKLFGLQHQPQWWTYTIKAPFFPVQDKNDGGHWIKRRRPPVYEEKYYEELRGPKDRIRKRRKNPLVPNLLVPISGLVAPVEVPTLVLLPPPPPVPSLTMGPPPFRLATPEEIAMDDEFIIQLLLED